MNDFKELGAPTFLDVFNKAIAEKILEFGKAHKPFDEQCARLDFKDKLEAMQRESERVHGFVRDDLKVDFADLDKFGDASRFEMHVPAHANPLRPGNCPEQPSHRDTEPSARPSPSCRPNPRDRLSRCIPSISEMNCSHHGKQPLRRPH